MMLFTAELAARKSQGPPSITCLDPGTVNTKMLIQGWGRCGIEIEVGSIKLNLAILKLPAPTLTLAAVFHSLGCLCLLLSFFSWSNPVRALLS